MLPFNVMVDCRICEIILNKLRVILGNFGLDVKNYRILIKVHCWQKYGKVVTYICVYYFKGVGKLNYYKTISQWYFKFNVL